MTPEIFMLPSTPLKQEVGSLPHACPTALPHPSANQLPATNPRDWKPAEAHPLGRGLKHYASWQQMPSQGGEEPGEDFEGVLVGPRDTLQETGQYTVAGLQGGQPSGRPGLLGVSEPVSWGCRPILGKEVIRFTLHISRTPGARGYRSATAPPALCDRATTHETMASIRTVTEADTSLREVRSSVPPAQKEEERLSVAITPTRRRPEVLQRPKGIQGEETAASSSPLSRS